MQDPNNDMTSRASNNKKLAPEEALGDTKPHGAGPHDKGPGHPPAHAPRRQGQEGLVHL
jgi:hypothetical protein